MGYDDRAAGTLAELLEMYTVDTVKQLYKVALEHVQKEMDLFRLQQKHSLQARPPGRKGEVIALLCRMLEDPEVLQHLYNNLGEVGKAAVQEAVYSPQGSLDLSKFRAKYGKSPSYVSEYSYGRGSAYLLSLFISSKGNVPPDLRKLLASFVPRPRAVEVRITQDLPETVEIDGEEVELVQHRTEQAALHDVTAVLYLIQHGKVGASSATGFVTESGAAAIREVLLHGDFYPTGTEAPDKYDVQMGKPGIRPFAWGMLVQAGKLAKVEGTKLKLTRAGQAAMTELSQKTLKGLWEHWLTTSVLHELNRVDVIKGQRSHGNPLQRADYCRASVANTLHELPPGKWVETGELFRFLQARGHTCSIARDPWKLYIVDREYGSFGYNHITWGHLEGRFARVFLMEYAATLGVIDIAVVPPWGAVDDIGDLWGADNYSCLSRYDGLRYLRLTPLGSWILGLAGEYTPAPVEHVQLFTVLPNFEIAVTAPSLPAAERLFVERISEKISDKVWRLSKDKILLALEGNLQSGAIRDFLLSRSGTDALPKTVETFLVDIESRASKLRSAGTAVLIECADESTAALIANDSTLKKLCYTAGSRYLVVPSGNELSFRNALRKIGFIVSSSGRG